jgi:hypothetical protein
MGRSEGGYFVGLLVDSALWQGLLQLVNLCLGEVGVVSDLAIVQKNYSKMTESSMRPSTMK